MLWSMWSKWGGSWLVALVAAGVSACGGEREDPALSGVTAITVGTETSCALIDDGSVRCWGFNFSGQFGTASPASAWSAVAVPHVADAMSVSVGVSHACAALADGSVKCWGELLGPSGGTKTPSPAIPVDGVEAAKMVAAATYHSCALRTDGRVQCWGNGALVPLGDGSLSTTPFPVSPRTVTVAELSDATAVAVSHSSSCALRENGEVKCWGETLDDTSADETGRFLNMYTPTPRLVEDLPSAAGIALGSMYGCAVLRDGTVACWGRVPVVMGGSRGGSPIPVAVGGLSDVAAVSARDSHACALLKDRTIRCWGANPSGQLGDGSEVSSEVPVRVQGIDNAIAVAVGSSLSCALLADGTVRCWGAWAKGCTDAGCTASSSPQVVRVAQ